MRERTLLIESDKVFLFHFYFIGLHLHLSNLFTLNTWHLHYPCIQITGNLSPNHEI